MARICNRIRACLAAGAKNCNPFVDGAGLGDAGQRRQPRQRIERLPDADHTFTSPDGQVRVEQYSKKKDESIACTSSGPSTRRHRKSRAAESRRRHRSCRLPPDFDLAATANGWCGCRARRRLSHAVSVPADRDQFSPATPKPLGDMAWDYFSASQCPGRCIGNPGDRDSLNHFAGTSGPGDGR